MSRKRQVRVNMVQSKSFSKTLRKSLTPEERKLWFLLRDRRLKDFKFRRQVTIDKYIVDFCCFDKRLIIEVDGGQHNDILNIQKDEERDKYLQKQGFRILRFWNGDVNNNEHEVLESILLALINPSSGLRPPSPARGEGQGK
jgi:very-short-patch-repair endonuclease